MKLFALLMFLITASDAKRLRGLRGEQRALQQSSNGMLSSGSVNGRGGAGGAAKGFDTTRSMMGSNPQVPIPVETEEGGGNLLALDDTSGVSVDNEAVYEVVFTNLWSSSSHPNDYPSNAHWSPPVIVGHSPEYMMWGPDSNATSGVQSVAETGSTTGLFGELNAAGSSIADTARGTIQFNSNTPSQTLSVRLDSAHPLVSAITMIAPSPDWFSGLYNVLPQTDGEWWQEFVIETYPWDAGTDDGTTYSSQNIPTSPHEPIFQITADTSPPTSQVFVRNGDVQPVARWTFTLL